MSVDAKLAADRLPSYLTRFVGREAEIAQLETMGEDDRSVLAGLAVFVGGFTREAAEEVTGASMTSLATLVERSLIQRLPDTWEVLATRSTSWCGVTPSSAWRRLGRRPLSARTADTWTT